MLKKLIWPAIGAAWALLQVWLIAGKLVGHIHWSWPLVLMPLWAPFVLAVIAALGAIAMFASASSNGRNPFQ